MAMMSVIQSNVALALVGVVMVSLWQPIASHGRLWTPPSRGSMFRQGYDTPADYNDMGHNCGGVEAQKQNDYKCGICGDLVTGPLPHEAGGRYATNTTTGTYTQGQIITIQVEITANHKGWFEFKLCPVNDYKVKATQDCLDRYVLQLTQFPGTTKLDVSDKGNSMVDIEVQLPTDLTCTFCTLQWKYHAGNSWGVGNDGKGCMGCGFQEEFYGCADVAIGPNGSTSGSSSGPSVVPASGSIVVPASGSVVVPSSGSSSVVTSSGSPSAIRPAGTREYVPMVYKCRAVMSVPRLADWCDTACNLDFCPASHCDCRKIPDPRFKSITEPGCYAIAPFSKIPGSDGWCNAVYRLGFCPKSKCFRARGRN